MHTRTLLKHLGSDRRECNVYGGNDVDGEQSNGPLAYIGDCGFLVWSNIHNVRCGKPPHLSQFVSNGIAKNASFNGRIY